LWNEKHEACHLTYQKLIEGKARVYALGEEQNSTLASMFSETRLIM